MALDVGLDFAFGGPDFRLASGLTRLDKNIYFRHSEVGCAAVKSFLSEHLT